MQILQCPKCCLRFTVQDEDAGGTQHCPRCHTKTRLPSNWVVMFTVYLAFVLAGYGVYRGLQYIEEQEVQPTVIVVTE